MTQSTLPESNSGYSVNPLTNWEIGEKFSSNTAGNILALRFYKASGETGSHVGRIWSNSGTLLGSATYTGESASGWQQVALATPVSITAGTTYVVSVNINSKIALCTSTEPRTNTTGQLTIPVSANLYNNSGTGTFPNTVGAAGDDYATSLLFDDLALTVGSITLNSQTTSSANLTFSGTTGGTTPYSYKWYRSTVSGFTPGAGNLISGATTTTLNDTGLTQNTYYYKVVVTDNVGNTATSAQQTVTIFSTYDVAYLAIGDSITAGYSTSDTTTKAIPVVAKNFLAAFNGARSVFVLNRGVTGSASADWLSTGTNLPAAINAFNSALTGYNAIIKIAAIMIGTNDSKASVNTSNSTYKSNLQNLINSLLAAGFIVELHYPPAINASSGDLSVAGNSTILGYHAQINSLINGKTVQQGDVSAYAHTLAYPSEQSDGIHPGDIGSDAIGKAHGMATWLWVYGNKARQARKITV